MQYGMPTLIENKTLNDNIALCKELGLSFIELNMNFPEYQIDKLEKVTDFYKAADDAEIYYITAGSGYVWLDDEKIWVKPGDIIVIPPHVFHWIDNTMNEEEFKLFTLWPKQEQNGVYFVRKEAWGKSMKYVDENYLEKRMEK